HDHGYVEQQRSNPGYPIIRYRVRKHAPDLHGDGQEGQWQGHLLFYLRLAARGNGNCPITIRGLIVLKNRSHHHPAEKLEQTSNEAGFSLMETAIALVLMTIVGLGAASL